MRPAGCGGDQRTSAGGWFEAAVLVKKMIGVILACWLRQS